MATEDFFEQIDPELFDLAVVIDYRTPLVPLQNHGHRNQVWIRIRALAGEENARVGVEVVDAAREQSQRSLGQPLQVLHSEHPVNSPQTPPNRTQATTSLPSNATQSTTHAESSGILNSTGSSIPQRRSHNPMQQTYQRFRNFVRTITRRR
jgi:hypothetical protein